MPTEYKATQVEAERVAAALAYADGYSEGFKAGYIRAFKERVNDGLYQQCGSSEASGTTVPGDAAPDASGSASSPGR